MSCPKIKVIIPMNPIVPSLREGLSMSYKSLGAYSFAFYSFTKVGMAWRLAKPETVELLRLIDPFTFSKQLATIPKYVIMATGDEFMMFDWSNIWLQDMQRVGETHLSILPNTDHILVTQTKSVIDQLSTFITMVNLNITRPKMSFNRSSETGLISVKTSQRPSAVRMWQA